MGTFFAILLALVIGYAVGQNVEHHNVYKLVIRECEELGGFIYGRTTVRCGNVTVTRPEQFTMRPPPTLRANENPPPTYPKPEAPSGPPKIPQPTPEP